MEPEQALIAVEQSTLSPSPLLGSLAGELSEKSRRIYAHDAQVFADWLRERGVTAQTLDRQVVTEYRAHLLATHRSATAKRMFSVARRILVEQVDNGTMAANPAKGVKGIKAEDESPHIALSKEQARRLLGVIPMDTKKGLRDYALILMLLYTGLRRFEAAALTLGDLGMEQGQHTLNIKEGKGSRREKVKLRVEAHRAITAYLEACGRTPLGEKAPLFCQFRKGDTPVEAPNSSNVVYRTVLQYGEAAGLEKDLTPHGMRASFVTLALEGKATLPQVQVAARHKDPRTTERYWRRKQNLDDNAVDYIRL